VRAAGVLSEALLDDGGGGIQVVAQRGQHRHQGSQQLLGLHNF
jgi:hypothetical protein